MSILKRFKDIMASNVNALLDKMEDPSKMIDQIMRDLEDDLAQVKSETAGVMAEEQRTKRLLDANVAEVNKMQAYAEKAVAAGNDDDARLFLSKKAQFTEVQAGLQKAYDMATDNSEKMRAMYDKLVEQIGELNSRRAGIKAKVSVAKAQERINELGTSVKGADASMSAFDRMEEKADNMMDRASAMAELDRNADTDKLDTTMKKYEEAPAKSVDDELAALKAKMGK
jgi:phage shock protein A